jgi:hypothetical protein
MVYLMVYTVLVTVMAWSRRVMTFTVAKSNAGRALNLSVARKFESDSEGRPRTRTHSHTLIGTDSSGP